MEYKIRYGINQTDDIPLSFPIYVDDFEGMTEAEIRENLQDQAQEHFKLNIGPVLLNVDEAVDWIAAQSTPAKSEEGE